MVGMVGVIVLVGEEAAVAVAAGFPGKRPVAALHLDCPPGGAGGTKDNSARHTQHNEEMHG